MNHDLKHISKMTLLSHHALNSLCSQQIPSNQNDVIQLCEEKNCSFYACADSLVAIMESLVTQTREWLIPVHITCSKKFGEFDILIKVSPL